ncbi:YbaB/EbfC family DNA-binding protein [Nocardia speluncae]|uniref:YbaB/EbfC family DNA-binding protein n=1 Tax=Nocardia speluncae TaxID=419477 RepID=A0A846XAV4_9NOCA|nr:YbaB/EbfC family nucleoid-associated protein [Nocardia speluncae]NKY31776.1 YbaB/EbfC family DNA-binding protein [Nocardia speluncae]
MVGGRELGDVAGILEGLRKEMGTLADLEQRRAQFTATATMHDKRVTVTVNAEGHLIDLRFSSKIDSLDYGEIATAVVAATKAAAADVARQAEELIAPLRQHQAQMPNLHELVGGMPDLQAEIPAPPPVLSQVPDPDVLDEPSGMIGDARSVVAADQDEAPLELQFSDVEELGAVEGPTSDSQVADSGWG